MINFIYHRLAKRPYKLYTSAKISKDKVNVIFLHGIASDSNTWRYVLPLLPDDINPITIDLTGFGNSPKPSWPSYNTKFHAKQVVYTLKKIGLKQPVTIVAHSMGSLIAINIAKNHPRLVKNLILCGAPLYASGEIAKTVENHQKTGRQVTNILFNIYERLIIDKEVTLKGAQQIMKITHKYNSFVLTKNTWIPFKKSLINTIMEQKALSEIAKLKLPIHFINGMSDVLIISRHQKNLAKKYSNISQESATGGHLINPLSAKKVVKAITNS